jgi:alpha-L-rhamnosidase
VSSAWKLEEGKTVLDVNIPSNTTATVFVPASGPDAIMEGGKPLSGNTEIQINGTEKNYVEIKLGSGKYQFVISDKNSDRTAVTRSYK